MPVKLSLLPVTDFTGGLNLRANVVQLAANESPDMLNVDLDPRGGFAMRKAVTDMNTTGLSTVPVSIWDFNTVSGTKQVLVVRSSGSPDSEILYSTGGNFTAIATPAAHTSAAKHRAVTFSNGTTERCYIQNGSNKAMVWTGAALTELTDPAVGATWDADFASPGTGDMPIGFFIANHQGSVWVGYTVENGTAKPHRVRWSHPARAEAWRSQDYIDIDVDDGDQITGLVPFGERLLVFKSKSIHVISGYSPANFQVQTISQKVGAISQEAICATEDAVYFFSWPGGVYRWTPRGGVEWLFEKIYPAIEDGSILSGQLNDICLGWINQRLWVSCTIDTGTDNNAVFVYDPRLGRGKTGRPQGGWMLYDLKLGPFLAWTPPGSATRWLACSSNTDRVLELEQDADNDTVDQTTVQIESFYTTRWYDVETPSQFKRWKRPEFLVEREHSSDLSVDVFIDYDPATTVKAFTISPVATGAGGTMWGDNWGTLKWSDDTNVAGVQIKKGSNIGRARSVQLRINGPATSVRWTVAAISFKFQPLRIRA